MDNWWEDKEHYLYPDGYKIKPIAEQIKVIARQFGLSGKEALAYAANLPELPQGAEGWFAIPRWEVTAESYGRAVWEAMFWLTRPADRFINSDYLEVRGGRLRQSEHSERMFQHLCDQQAGSDIIITPAQFGLRHCKRTAFDVRQSFGDDSNEFGLGVFHTICMLVTHIEREQYYEQLHLVCVGDEYESLGGRWEQPGFHRVPQIQFGGEVENTYEFSSLPIRGGHWLNGSVTGFLPECR